MAKQKGRSLVPVDKEPKMPNPATISGAEATSETEKLLAAEAEKGAAAASVPTKIAAPVAPDTDFATSEQAIAARAVLELGYQPDARGLRELLLGAADVEQTAEEARAELEADGVDVEGFLAAVSAEIAKQRGPAEVALEQKVVEMVVERTREKMANVEEDRKLTADELGDSEYDLKLKAQLRVEEERRAAGTLCPACFGEKDMRDDVCAECEADAAQLNAADREVALNAAAGIEPEGVQYLDRSIHEDDFVSRPLHPPEQMLTTTEWAEQGVYCSDLSPERMPTATDPGEHNFYCYWRRAGRPTLSPGLESEFCDCGLEKARRELASEGAVPASDEPDDLDILRRLIGTLSQRDAQALSVDLWGQNLEIVQDVLIRIVEGIEAGTLVVSRGGEAEMFMRVADRLPGEEWMTAGERAGLSWREKVDWDLKTMREQLDDANRERARQSIKIEDQGKQIAKLEEGFHDLDKQAHGYWETGLQMREDRASRIARLENLAGRVRRWAKAQKESLADQEYKAALESVTEWKP